MIDLFPELDRAPGVAAYTEAAQRLEAADVGLRPVRVALLSSFTIAPFLPFLKVEAARRGFAADTYLAPFGHGG